VMECASAVINTVPLAILPGGTLNISAAMLGIPLIIEKAFELIYKGDNIVKSIDVAQITSGQNSKIYLQRASLGYEALAIASTSPEDRKRYGQKFSYISTFIREFLKRLLRNHHFKLTLDGKETLKLQGLECVIVNSGMIFPGVFGLDNMTGSSCDIEDGLLNIILFERDTIEKQTILRRLFDKKPVLLNLNRIPQQWLAKEIIIESTSSGYVQCDGEIISNAPVNIKILPKALCVITSVNKKQSKTIAKLEYISQLYQIQEGSFPTNFVNQQWQKNRYITSLAWGNRGWVVVMSEGVNFSQQTYISANKFPQSEIEEYWHKGYYITALAYGNAEWFIVMSKGVKFPNQSYITSGYLPKNLIEEGWKKKHKITDLAYGSGRWVVVMSEETDILEQTYRTSEDIFFPAYTVYNGFSKNQYITSLVHDETKLVLVRSLDTKLSKQIFVTRAYFPGDAIEKYWEHKYYITSLTCWKNRWTVILSK
jgi:diacylglycerol kinase family enzyme